MISAIPTLSTERLIIRTPIQEEFPAFLAFCKDERSKWLGGPVSENDAQAVFASYLKDAAENLASYMHIVVKETGDVAGMVGIRFRDQRPEPEITYSLYSNAFEGKGYATEAASVVRDWALANTSVDSFVSYIDPANTPSIAVAARMGARPDPNATPWPKHPDLSVYRHTPSDRDGGIEAYA